MEKEKKRKIKIQCSDNLFLKNASMKHTTG